MSIRELCPQLSEEAGRTPVIALGIEGSANKVGVGIIRYNPETEEYETVANVRKTYITPAGQGFLPRETAWHHQQHVVALVRAVSLFVSLCHSILSLTSFFFFRRRYNKQISALPTSLSSATQRVLVWEVH
jgi:hypothetical protein